MADTLIIRLSGIADVIVSPLSSVRRYSALEQDPLAAGRELNVKSVLDGSVQKDGDQLRVSARLLNVADGRPIWSDRFDEKYTNLLAVQDAIADRVTSALALTLSAAERDRIERRATADPVAYDVFLKGRRYWSRRNVWGNLDRAVGAFEQAVACDPAFALAQLGLADARPRPDQLPVRLAGRARRSRRGRAPGSTLRHGTRLARLVDDVHRSHRACDNRAGPRDRTRA